MSDSAFLFFYACLQRTKASKGQNDGRIRAILADPSQSRPRGNRTWEAHHGIKADAARGSRRRYAQEAAGDLHQHALRQLVCHRDHFSLVLTMAWLLCDCSAKSFKLCGHDNHSYYKPSDVCAGILLGHVTCYPFKAGQYTGLAKRLPKMSRTSY